MSLSENSYEFQVSLKYQLYNSIFLTLHFATIRQTGIELPIFREYITQSMRDGMSPLEIIRGYFEKHSGYSSLDEQHALLFRFIQYVERQVVLIDALEEAGFERLNDMNGPGSIRHFTDRVRRHDRMGDLREKLRDFRVKIVLTAHPTQFYPGYVLGIINDLSDAFRDNDLHEIRRLLEQLGQTPFFKKEKPTPFDEATSLGWYLENIFYHALPDVVRRITEETGCDDIGNDRLLEVGFWPGGDRDGNPYVSADITLQVARRLKFILYKSYYNDIRALKRRLTFRKVLPRVESLEEDLRQELFEKFGQSGFRLDDFQARLAAILDVVNKEHNGFCADRLQDLLLKTRLFADHFASLDIRQDSRVIDRAFREWLKDDVPGSLEEYFNLEVPGGRPSADDPVIKDLYAVFQTIGQIQEENGDRACHRFIISNCRGAESVGQIYAMAANLSLSLGKLDIVPLFETIDDLENCHRELERLYGSQAYRRHLKVRGERQYVMLGFSDGTKDGGYFSANWNIYKAKERMTAVSRDNSIEVVFFDGRGGPPARGGGNVHKYYAAQGATVEDKEIQLTIQGQTISSRFSSVPAACHYLENLLTAGLENGLLPDGMETSDDEEGLMNAIARESLSKYSALKTRADFLPYLEHRSPLTWFGKTNIGSRPSKRGKSSQLTLDDLRAIPFVGSWSAMKQNVPGYFGLGYALSKMAEEYGMDALRELYRNNAFFESLVSNSMQSLSKSRMELTRYLEMDDEYGDLWRVIEAENKLTVKMISEIVGATDWHSVLASNTSIELRENIVLPLLIIQQYALIRLEERQGDTEVFEKLVIRTLYGIINAARNSA